MSDADRPVIVAFDGSPEAHAAIRAAAGLFGSRPLLIVSVWEPGLARVMQSQPDPMGMTYPAPSAEEIATLDRIESGHAESVAEAGARLARGLGATAEPAHVPDGLNIADTLISVAEQHDAAAIVVGSRGLGAVRSRLFGSTSRGLLHHARRPVVVVRGHDD
jgi:nucleotide-binding universal stress UspA family protein